MSANNLSIPVLMMVYVGVLGTVALGAGYAYSNVNSKIEDGTAQSPREKTILDDRIATAREIKEALRRPITAKVANPQGNKVASVPEKKKIKIPRAALNAMAMDRGGMSPSGSYSTVDRAGAGGW
jgi:hypothetical protein